MQSGGRKAAIRHVAALDGARGAAVAGVLLFHGGHLRGGYLGVDFFFTLSGFLITSLLLAESSRTGSIGLGGFWARRARRLLPALAVLMVGVALYCAVLASADQLTQIRWDAFATLAYVANWRAVFAHQSYWSLFNAPSPLNHTWSLAIEEQFYLLWPLAFVALLARWKGDIAKAVFVTAVVLAGVSSVLMVVLYDPANSARSYYGTDTRAAAILFGVALAAWLAMKGPTRDRVALEVVGLVAAAVLAVAWTRLDGQSSTLYRGGFLVCGLCATAVIAAAVHPDARVLSRVLSWRPLCALGLISYGVYLYHWPINVVFDAKRVGLEGWPLLGVQTAITVAVAVVSYQLIEQPIRRGRFSSRQLRVITPAIALGLVGALAFSTAGAEPALSAAPGSNDPVAAAAKASAAAAPNARRVMIVGNSVGFFLAAAMQTIHTDPPLAVLDAALPACSFVPGTKAQTRLSDGSVTVVPTFGCHPARELVALKRFRPTVVFWVVSGPPAELWRDGHWILPCSAQYASLFRHRLRDEIARLSSGGAKVVITTAAYSRYFLHGSDNTVKCENPLRREVAHATGAQLIDLFEFICPRGQCRDKQNGVLLRVDGLHYRDAGGRIVAHWLIDHVDPADWRK